MSLTLESPTVLAPRCGSSSRHRWSGTHLALETSRHRRVPLSGIQVPTIFIPGRWDVLTGASDIANAAARMPQATYIELRGGRFLPLEQPEAIQRELRALIRGVRARDN